MMRRVLLLGVLFASLAHAAPAPQPPALGGAESVAATDDARAYLFNPAALGQRYPSEWFVAWSGHNGANDRTYAVGTWQRLGFGWSRERGLAQSYGLGFSLGDERLRLGWASDLRVAAAPRSERRLDSRAGLLARPAPWLSLGANAEHVFEPRFMNTRLPRQYTLGLGLRPLALSRERAHTAGTRLTLTGDVTLLEGADRAEARTRVGIACELLRGVELRAMAEDHRGVQLGVALRGVRNSASALQRSVDDTRAYESYAFSAHEGEDRPATHTRKDKRVALVRAGGTLADETLPGGLLGGGGERPAAPLHAQLERALTDPLTRGVFLDLSGVRGMAQLEELRPRLVKLKQAGKPVVAFMEYGGGRGDLYLASAATRVYATPAAEFVGLGLRAERRYYRQALAKLGVRMDRASVGDFKSAYRNYSVDSTPAPDTMVIQRMLSQRQQLFVDALTAGRGITSEQLLPVLDGREYAAGSLAKLGVIDSVGWREDAMAELGRLTGLGKKPRSVNLLRSPEARERWATPGRIAVVYASGAIVTGRSGSDPLDGGVIGDQTFVRQLERAFKAPGVRAVVLRIESPGGSAAASYLMDHAVERLRRETKKPLVVSMGSVAASGGYFMAAHADKIFADKHTVTGSIGVLFVKPSFEQLYARWGVRQDDFERGDYMRGLSPARDWRPREQAAADSAVRRHYRTFVSRVADGRKLEAFEVLAHAQGRPWMGEDAAERKLVDGIGGLDAAISEARRLAGIPEGEKLAPLEFRRPRGTLLERVLGGWVREQLSAALSLKRDDGAEARTDDWVEELD